ncbi:hypothetical protein [Terriglobus saanensis]|uniref:Phosphoesterase DHHA1 n=1 Tax=Terriglobus saanensis (strain ATCC BAA-1853 / DSM 23119 / SP1PR4) TaxID=401053 RepID=E8V552_TERSS|nr:hypothetical protein [Terriglobus saanensis]ADV83739.1 hypothetical protein AciPR4_2979 [Terriglobus saanensis SP1PR4]
MHLRVLFHNNCFDGACSASLFTRFHRECIGGVDEYSYKGLMHKAGAQFDPADFLEVDKGNQNAIVDFKYWNSPKLTWWFDHHQSAFLTPEDRAQFDAQQTDGPHAMRQFFDPNYISCAGFIAHVASKKFGFDTSGLKDLIYWANLIDGAKYESARSAVEMDAPAMRLGMIIEAAKDKTLIPRLIPMLTEMSFAELLEQDFIAQEFEPLMAEHKRAIGMIRNRGLVEDGVISFDLADEPIDGYNKFIPYYLHPEALYTVGLTKASFRTKISVGTNPWFTVPENTLINIAAICERYGGGGHARVGAISFPPDADGLAKARVAAAEVLAELQGR